MRAESYVAIVRSIYERVTEQVIRSISNPDYLLSAQRDFQTVIDGLSTYISYFSRLVSLKKSNFHVSARFNILGILEDRGLPLMVLSLKRCQIWDFLSKICP